MQKKNSDMDSLMEHLNNLLLHVDGSEVNGYCSASAEYFKNDDVWHYPLVSGKYFPCC